LPPFNESIIPNNSTIIVGLSGGPDSIYLLHKLYSFQKKFNIKIIAAHLDHEWQSSSQIASDLCQTTCNSLRISLIIKKASELEFKHKWNGSKEELGRNMRRYFFESLADEYAASAIALGHHQQDQQETFFIRLLRGSSLAGLVGIKNHDELYIRPLLESFKEDIMEYLTKNKILFYNDPTNTSDDYLRNRIRNHLIPCIKKIDDRFEKNLTTTMNQLSQTDHFITQSVNQEFNKILKADGLILKDFLELHIMLQQRILLKFMITENISFKPSQKLFNEMIRFLKNKKNNKHTIYPSWTIEKKKDIFKITKEKNSDKNLLIF